MPGSIVVPLDGSKNAENALPWAATLARLYGATVKFVHVLGHETAEGADLPAEERFATYTAGLAARLGIARHESQVLRGHPANAVVDAAAHERFIVIASHGQGGFRATFVGSVADKVIRNATVPVFLIPAIGAPAAPDRHTLLVALDGSGAAERGLDLARELAGKMDTTVTLVRAWAYPMQATASFEPYYSSPDLFESIEAAANDYIAATALPGEKAMAVMGPAAVAIGDAAARLDPELVIVTTSGKGLAARIALGSTTERLAHSLHRPLLVVPAER